MALVIPNIEDASFAAQAAPDSVDFMAMQGGTGAPGSGIISGCQVTALGSPAMAVQVSVGVLQPSPGMTLVVAGSTSLSVAGALSGDRKDIVVASLSTGVVSVIEGSPCLAANWSQNSVGILPPRKPFVPTGFILLAEILVRASTSVIVTGLITDKALVVLPPSASADIELNVVVTHNASKTGTTADFGTVQAFLLDSAGSYGYVLATPVGEQNNVVSIVNEATSITNLAVTAAAGGFTRTLTPGSAITVYSNDITWLVLNAGA